MNRVVFQNLNAQIIGERDMPTVPVIGDYIAGIEGKTGPVSYRRYNFASREWTVVLDIR